MTHICGAANKQHRNLLLSMNFSGIRQFLLFVLIAPFGSWGQTFTVEDSLRGGNHALRSCYDLTHYRLSLRIEPKTRFISGNNRLTFNALVDMKSLQVDLAPTFVIEKIISPLGTVKWSQKGTSILVTLAQKIPAGQVSWIQVHYSGHPHVAENAPWQGGFVWQNDSENLPWIGVACEGEGSSLWFPSKDYPADEPDSVLLQYEVPKNLLAVGNGQFIGKKAISDSTVQYSYRVTYPINHYNITLNVAAYQTWSDTLALTNEKAPLKMKFYALNQDVEKAKKQFPQAKQVVKELSQLFGNYPFMRDGYQLVQTPFLGMEHQSCIAYGDKFKDNAFGFDFIIMHETGHEWWGNRTSASDHADMWIHESFCTYSEALFLERTQNMETAIQYLLVQKKKIKNKTPIQGPRGVFFNDWKDSDMYYKGTWMLHSLRSVIGNDELWFGWLKSFGVKFGLKPIASEDVIAYSSAYFKQDLSPFFDQFLLQTDWPLLEYKIEKKDGKAYLAFRWNCKADGFEYPVEVFIDGKSKRIHPKKTWERIEISNERVKIEGNMDQFLFKMEEVKH